MLRRIYTALMIAGAIAAVAGLGFMYGWRAAMICYLGMGCMAGAIGMMEREETETEPDRYVGREDDEIDT